MPAANRAVRQANDDAVGVIVVLGIAAVLVGVIVGAVGVGGVLLPPALILLGGLAPADATAISLISFTLAGAVSAGMFLRGGEFPTAVVGRLAVGLVPAAFVGGWLSDRIPAAAVLAALCAVCLFSALWTTIRPTPQSHRDSLAAGSAVPIGALDALNRRATTREVLGSYHATEYAPESSLATLATFTELTTICSIPKREPSALKRWDRMVLNV